MLRLRKDYEKKMHFSIQMEEIIKEGLPKVEGKKTQFFGFFIAFHISARYKENDM